MFVQKEGIFFEIRGSLSANDVNIIKKEMEYAEGKVN